MSSAAHAVEGGAGTRALFGKDLLLFVAEGTAGTVGQEFFQCLAEHLALAFRAEVGFVAEVAPEDRDVARFLACYESGKLISEAFEYQMAGTPCAELAGADVVSYPHGLIERFPEDEMVAELGLESYLAIALRGSDGAHLGHLGVLAAAPLHPEEEDLAVLRIFAARAAGELERRAHERALREREESHRALAEEQAALRRVATLVAAEAHQQELLETVANEVGLLFDADVSTLVRYDGERVEILAGWSRSPADAVPVGLVVDVDRSTATKKALRTGRPARAESQEMVAPGAAPILGRLGIRAAIAAPIKVSGELWGAVTAARTRKESFPLDAQHRLGAFAELVAQAIANTEAQEELAASRVRIVHAGDAERRRLARNLHDGAQQRLVTLSLSLRLADAKLRDDPEAREVLAQASEELALALQELRDLAHGIHPAVLTDHGLGPALEALASRAPIPVNLVAKPDRRLPESVEATAYYVVAEALTNVAKYANATVGTVTATCVNDQLLVEVADDGVGGADPGRGSGLRGLVDRVHALHGALRVDSRAGSGTRVVASIPLTEAPAAS